MIPIFMRKNEDKIPVPSLSDNGYILFCVLGILTCISPKLGFIVFASLTPLYALKLVVENIIGDIKNRTCKDVIIGIMFFIFFITIGVQAYNKLYLGRY